MQAVQQCKQYKLSLAMPILVCPACGVGVELEDPGVWRRDCGRIYSRDPRNGVIYFVEEESYAESFGLQWKTFSREQLDNDRLRDSARRAVIYKSYPLKRSVLDTFDIYATELESRHRPKEVFCWFREAGLTNIDLLDGEDGWVSVRGRAPAHSSLD